MWSYKSGHRLSVVVLNHMRLIVECVTILDGCSISARSSQPGHFSVDWHYDY